MRLQIDDSAAHRGRRVEAAARARSSVVIDSLVSASEADGLWLDLLDLVGVEADLRLAGTALVVEGVERHPVMGLADLAHVFFQARVREERHRLRRRCRRARQRAGAHRDVRQELSDLERVAALLLELVEEGRLASLLRLLFSRACVEQRLTGTNLRVREPRAQTSDLLTGLQLPGEVIRLDALIGLCSAERLPIALIEEVGRRRAKRHALLAREVRCSQTGPVAAKSSSLDGIANLLLSLDALFLRQVSERGAHDAAQIGRHVLVDVLTAYGANALRAAHGHLRASTIEGKRSVLDVADPLNARFLRLVDWRDEVACVGAVLLERRPTHRLGALVDRAIASHHFRRNLHLLRCRG